MPIYYKAIFAIVYIFYSKSLFLSMNLGYVNTMLTLIFIDFICHPRTLLINEHYLNLFERYYIII